MSEQDNSPVSLLSYHELMLTLQGLCREKQSGVMVISSESGGTAQLTLEQGAIFDCVFAGMNGKTALVSIKKIIRGKAKFFKRTPGVAVQHIDLSTAEILQTLLSTVPDTTENTPSIQARVVQAVNDEHTPVIEAHLAIIVGPVARIIYQEYREEIQQAHELDKLGTVIEKIAKQTLSSEKQTVFKQNIRDFMSQSGLKDQQSIVNLLRSTISELKLNPVTLSIFISKFATQGELSTTLLTRLATHIEQAGNLAGSVKLFDILRFLEKTTKTGVLSIAVKDKKAGFYFNQGVLINAFEGSQHGVAAALDILQWQPDQINFVCTTQTTVAREIHQTVEVLLKNIPAGIINREEALKHNKIDRTINEIQAALSKEIERLQGRVSDKKEDSKHPETESLIRLKKAIQLAESYDNIGSESILCEVLLMYDNNFNAWFWLAKVLSNMTAVEFALKKAANLNARSSELADEVKKFTVAKKLLKSDFVLRCPFCWMPVNQKDHECPHCLANFFIDSGFFSKAGKARTDILDKAITRFDNALQQQTTTNNIYLLFYLAMAYLNRQYYHEGLAQLNEIEKLAPENRALQKQGELLRKYMQTAGLISSTIQQPKLSATATKARILIVEDSAVTRKVIARTLIANGYEVFEAKNAEEALTDIVARNPDLVLLDIILPDRDGYQILAEIRQIKPIAKVPVVMLTSRDSLFDKLKGKVSDADEYLTKPFQPDELLLVVRKYLK